MFFYNPKSQASLTQTENSLNIKRLREKQETPINLAPDPFSSVLSLNQKILSSLTLPAERQKKTVNPTLRGYGISFRVEVETSNLS
jgi:hypothetical protein